MLRELQAIASLMTKEMIYRKVSGDEINFGGSWYFRVRLGSIIGCLA